MVRLRYMRARRAHPGLPKVGIAAARITRKSGGKKMPAIQLLQSRWKEIVGEKLYAYCRPEKLQGGRDGRVLVLKVIPQAAPIVQHQSEEIRQRVSVAAGGDITSLKIIQGPLPTRGASPTLRRKIRPLTPAEREDLATSTQSITDNKLRAAIVALGEAVLTAEE